MDIDSPRHLERLRDQPEIKAAYLRFYPAADFAWRDGPHPRSLRKCEGSTKIAIRRSGG